MKKFMRIGIIGVGVVFLATSLLYAQGNAGAEKSGKAGGRKYRKSVLKELNLTNEQGKSLEENRQGQRQRMVGIISALKAQKEKLEQVMKKDSATKAEVEPIVAEIKSLQAQLIDQRINGILAVKKILTPEQFTRFQELTQRKGGKMQGGGFSRQQYHRMHKKGNQGE